MPDHFLNSNKLATLPEFRYLLLEVLDRKDPVSWYDLSFSCKEFSLNFAFSFENSISFLQMISLVQVHVNRSVSRVPENYEALVSDENLGDFILRRTVDYLQNNKRLKDVFNKKTVLTDKTSDIILIHLTELPTDLLFIQSLLLNLGVLKQEKNATDKLQVEANYKVYFWEDLLPKVFEDLSPPPVDIAFSPSTSKPPTLFISYAYNDMVFKEELQKHLSGLKMLNLIRDWEGRAMLPGEDWDDEIRKKLEQAEIVLFLVSSDFMASEYINDVEIKKTIERYKQGQVRIIPIIVRPCDFDSLPIKRYQALPDRAKPVSKWENKDEAYLNIVTRIKEVIKQMSN